MDKLYGQVYVLGMKIAKLLKTLMKIGAGLLKNELILSAPIIRMN